MTITYWKHLRTGLIYKYFNGATPYNACEWRRVTAWDYEQALKNAREKYLNK